MVIEHERSGDVINPTESKPNKCGEARSPPEQSTVINILKTVHMCAKLSVLFYHPN